MFFKTIPKFLVKGGLVIFGVILGLKFIGEDAVAVHSLLRRLPAFLLAYTGPGMVMGKVFNI